MMKKIVLLAALVWAWAGASALAQSTSDYTNGFTSPAGSGAMAEPEPADGGAIQGGMRKIVLSSVPAPTVAELFTSEGCSSCPPADELLGELTQRQFVLPLSYHVDYWDYIGWKDRFAKPEFTKRQRAYAEVQGTRMVYTPQMIVAGAIDAVGSDRKQVNAALKRAFTRNAMYRIDVLQSDDGSVIARFPEAKIGVPATVWLVTYLKQAQSDVARGENAGRLLTSYNVVLSIKRAGVWRGEAMEIPLVLDPDSGVEPDGCALIANQADYGPIVAAAAFDYHRVW